MPTRSDTLHGEDKDTRTTVRVALVANVLIVTVKIAAGVVTRSPVLLSEAAHSAADTLNEVFLLVAVARFRRDPDEVDPFGCGSRSSSTSPMRPTRTSGSRPGAAVPSSTRHDDDRTYTTRTGQDRRPR